MVVVLLTGFEPFDGAPRNPSWDAVAALAEDGDCGLAESTTRISTLRLPVEFGAVRAGLADAIERTDPDLVIATGLAAGRAQVTVERIAVNLADARIPDNAGLQPREQEVVSGGPAGRWSTLPVTACIADARGAGYDVAASLSAGAFVCNAAMYHLLDLTADSPIRAGFVHVPATTPDSIADHDPLTVPPSLWPLDGIVGALAAIVRAATKDLR